MSDTSTDRDRNRTADHPAPSPEGRARFRQNLVKVMSMQLFALLILWLLQSRYAR